MESKLKLKIKFKLQVRSKMNIIEKLNLRLKNIFEKGKNEFNRSGASPILVSPSSRLSCVERKWKIYQLKRL